MTRHAITSVSTGQRQDETWLAQRVVRSLGGRYSSELGIDVDAGDAEIERWFLAATLFGARISAQVAERAFGVLCGAGLVRIAQARHLPSEDLIDLLDQGGYARYDFRTATRLVRLSEVIGERYDDRISVLGQRFGTYQELRAALDALPGWGPVTIELFLRELRGVWPGAQPPVADRAAAAARHLGLLPGPAGQELPRLSALAAASRLDVRDLESGLVRLALAHHRSMAGCQGGQTCVLLSVPRGRRPA